MRIIAGRFRGRKLVKFKADHIRPTTDRVKESVFNTLSVDIEESSVLDLFAGTGSLTFESLSRGASHVLAVELNGKSIDIIKRNQKELGVTPDELMITKMDVLKFVKSYQGDGFDLIFVDPPFTKKMAHDVMLILSRNEKFLKPHVRIIIESSKHEKIEDKYGSIVLEKRKDFGDKYVSFFEICDEKPREKSEESSDESLDEV